MELFSIRIQRTFQLVSTIKNRYLSRNWLEKMGLFFNFQVKYNR